MGVDRNPVYNALYQSHIPFKSCVCLCHELAVFHTYQLLY